MRPLRPVRNSFPSTPLQSDHHPFGYYSAYGDFIIVRGRGLLASRSIRSLEPHSVNMEPFASARISAGQPSSRAQDFIQTFDHAAEFFV